MKNLALLASITLAVVSIALSATVADGIELDKLVALHRRVGDDTGDLERRWPDGDPCGPTKHGVDCIDRIMTGQSLEPSNSTLNFDGVDDYVIINDDEDTLDFAVGQDFTVEAWIKIAPVQADITSLENDILSKWTGGSGYPYTIRYQNQTDIPNSGHIYVGRFDGVNSSYLPSTRSIADNRYHHVAFVKDGSNLYLYIDGILDGSIEDITVGDTTNSAPLTFGKRGTDNNYWLGSLDDVRIWNAARSQIAIRADMYGRLNGDETSLVGYWPLDEGEGDIAHDLTVNGNHGDLGGADSEAEPTWVERPMDGIYLMALYHSTGGENWYNNSGWGTDNPCSPRWHGVTCDSGQVIGLNLQANNLDGPIPPELGRLSTLQSLWLDSNQLSNIPPELGSLSSLQYLHLESNQLTSIPPELGLLGSLQILHLDNNQLTSIPPELGSLGNLQDLWLGYNQLTSLPPDLGSLSSLLNLRLYNNQLTGIPPELGSLGGLLNLYLDNNQLTGIPPELGSLASLQNLYLSHNQLTSIPPELGSLDSLQKLYLTDNQLTSIPAELGSLGSLQYLWLYNNQLTSIPAELGSLGSLLSLTLWNNQLTSIPPELGNLGSLQYLYLNHNQLTSIPPELGSLGSLGYLDLENNQLTSIPPELGSLGSLWGLFLYNNQLTSVPPELSSLSSLLYLSLSYNLLTSIPPELGSLSSLRRLYLDSNQLTSIPPELGSLSSLQDLHLESNQLISIPPELGSLGSLQVLHLQDNQLRGPIPARLSNMSSLQYLYLDNNPDLVCWQTQAALDWALGLPYYNGPQEACPFVCLPVMTYGD